MRLFFLSTPVHGWLIFGLHVVTDDFVGEYGPRCPDTVCVRNHSVNTGDLTQELIGLASVRLSNTAQIEHGYNPQVC